MFAGIYYNRKRLFLQADNRARPVDNRAFANACFVENVEKQGSYPQGFTHLTTENLPNTFSVKHNHSVKFAMK